MTPHQATVVAIAGRGVMIEGDPGAGKSSLALALIDRGARLVGDDSVMLEVADGRLLAHPHPATRGLLEVRNLGLLPVEPIAGVPIALVVRLDRDAPRYCEVAEEVHRGGAVLPMVPLSPEGSVLHLKVELALERYGLASD